MPPKLDRGELHWVSCITQEPAGRHLYWNQKEEPLPPVVSLQRPLLTTCNIVSADEDEVFQNHKQGKGRFGAETQ